MQENYRIVSSIFNLIEGESADDQTIIAMLVSEFNVTTDEAEDFLELVKTGISKAMIVSNGHSYPQSNLANHPIVITAQKMWIEKYKPQHKKWWQF